MSIISKIIIINNSARIIWEEEGGWWRSESCQSRLTTVNRVLTKMYGVIKLLIASVFIIFIFFLNLSVPTTDSFVSRLTALVTQIIGGISFTLNLVYFDKQL